MSSFIYFFIQSTEHQITGERARRNRFSLLCINSISLSLSSVLIEFTGERRGTGEKVEGDLSLRNPLMNNEYYAMQVIEEIKCLCNSSINNDRRSICYASEVIENQNIKHEIFNNKCLVKIGCFANYQSARYTLAQLLYMPVPM